MAERLYGELFTIAQFLTLIILLPALYHMLNVYLHEKKWKYYTMAFSFIFFSTLAALLREVYEFNTFRLLEWICITVASILFAYACYKNYISSCHMVKEEGAQGV